MSPQLLTPDDNTVRTQITLTAKLKQLIEQQASLQGLSLSEYLRRAAILKYQLEKQSSAKLSLLADRLIGSVKQKNHPEWASIDKIYKWSRSMREEWNNH